jgi:hypothetical protein
MTPSQRAAQHNTVLRFLQSRQVGRFMVRLIQRLPTIEPTQTFYMIRIELNERKGHPMIVASTRDLKEAMELFNNDALLLAWDGE